LADHRLAPEPESEPGVVASGAASAVVGPGPGARVGIGTEPPIAPPRPAPLGGIALTAAIVMLVTVAVSLAIDAPGRYLAATVLALSADVLSLAAIVVGIIAVIRARGRAAGVAALVIAVLGNPLVLLYGLGVLS
jgi:hypothetical protein